MLWHSVSLLSALSAGYRTADTEAVMTEQAVMEVPAAVTEPDGQDPGPGDEALVADELLVEEVSIDGMCGVY